MMIERGAARVQTSDDERNDAMLDLARIGSLLAERKPGHSLPQALYNDPAVFEFDLQAIYHRSWLLVGFECELPEPSGYLAATIGRSPIVVTRDRDGAIRGFHNSCRHRGAQVCAEGTGRKSRLVCPYHQWVYDLDGSLVHAGRMQADFDPREHALRPLHVEAVAGALFACLSDDPPPFGAFREVLEPMLAPHRLQEAKLAHASDLVERGNWKLVMENARECYHCGVGHPELARTFPVKVKEYFEDEGDPRHGAFRERLELNGLAVGPFHGPWWQCERFALNEGSRSLTMDGGFAVSKLMCEASEGDIGSLRWAIEPHSFCHSTADTTVSFSAMPTAPNETVVTCKWLVHKDAVEGVDYDVERLTELWTVTNLQDRDLVELNQRGVNSRGYTPGPYSAERESYVMRFVDWYCDAATAYLEGRKPASGPKRRRGRVAASIIPANAPAPQPTAVLGPDRT